MITTETHLQCAFLSSTYLRSSMCLSVCYREVYKSGLDSIWKFSPGNKVYIHCLLHKRTVPYLEMQATKLGMSEEPVSFSKWLIRSMEATEQILYFTPGMHQSSQENSIIFKSIIQEVHFALGIFLLHNVNSAPEAKASLKVWVIFTGCRGQTGMCWSLGFLFVCFCSYPSLCVCDNAPEMNLQSSGSENCFVIVAVFCGCCCLFV